MQHKTQRKRKTSILFCRKTALARLSNTAQFCRSVAVSQLVRPLSGCHQGQTWPQTKQCRGRSQRIRLLVRGIRCTNCKFGIGRYESWPNRPGCDASVSWPSQCSGAAPDTTSWQWPQIDAGLFCKSKQRAIAAGAYPPSFVFGLHTWRQLRKYPPTTG